jgi:serine/threonine protein kinase
MRNWRTIPTPVTTTADWPSILGPLGHSDLVRWPYAPKETCDFPSMKVCPTCRLTYPADFRLCPHDGGTLIVTGLWSEGSVVLGKYKILAKIGEGGMGSVFKALHLPFNEIRALKVMGLGLMENAAFRRRFEREAILARKLQHPNAVRVEDFDEADNGQPFIVMEYIDGQSFRKLTEAEGPLPVFRCCAILSQVASALDAAHRMGIVHRDIKPDNIMLARGSKRDLVKVLDFGIAKLNSSITRPPSPSVGDIRGTGPSTEAGTTIGTPEYKSPEQIRGKTEEEVDGRSDIYSLGVVAYQALTGELPMTGNTPFEKLMAQVQSPPRPIQSTAAASHIPHRLCVLVMKCLEKSRERRPASAAALIEELREIGMQVRQKQHEKARRGPRKTAEKKEVSDEG